jgi:RepB DNA-primase from phage plasmid
MSGAGADEREVRCFLRIVWANAGRTVRGLPNRGFLQVCSLAPDGEKAFHYRGGHFGFHRCEELIAHALELNEQGRNVYIEARTVRRDAKKRGKMEETAWVFALVIDSDGDKARAWADNVGASLMVETSPGNFQFWFFLREAIGWEEARAIGAAMRKFTKTDSDSGVVTQPYRIAGSINYPNAIKRARGRVPVPSRIVSHSGKIWTAAQLSAAFPPPAPPRPPRRPPLPPVGVKARKTSAPARPPVGVRARKTSAVVRAPLALCGLTSAQILDRYPHIRGKLREQLLPGGGPLGSEDKSAMRYRLAGDLYDRSVAAADALVLLINTPWNPDGFDADPKRLLKKKEFWGLSDEEVEAMMEEMNAH